MSVFPNPSYLINQQFCSVLLLYKKIKQILCIHIPSVKVPAKKHQEFSNTRQRGTQDPLDQPPNSIYPWGQMPSFSQDWATLSICYIYLGVGTLSIYAVYFIVMTTLQVTHDCLCFIVAELKVQEEQEYCSKLHRK